VLNDGSSISSTIDVMPPRLELKGGWTLKVQDWRPTDNLNSTETVFTSHTLALDSLAPWSTIPELQDVSGIGWYSTSFDLGSDWPVDAGAMLSIPNFVGSFRLSVNGKKLPAQDQLEQLHDIGPWLSRGINTIEIEVATTLLNRLRVAEPSAYGVAARQAYGLVSPILIQPYREAKIAA
jgi:hypothetical protein